jgi:hypothetical protein
VPRVGHEYDDVLFSFVFDLEAQEVQARHLWRGNGAALSVQAGELGNEKKLLGMAAISIVALATIAPVSSYAQYIEGLGVVSGYDPRAPVEE